MVLLAVGVDEALRVDPDPVLAVDRTSMDDIVTWGMECPDCVYLSATLRARRDLPVVRQPGHRPVRGSADDGRDGATTNCLVDDLEVDADGNFEAILSADDHDGNWLRIQGDHPTLVVRHFFYDWDTEKASSLQIERIGDRGRAGGSIGRSRCHRCRGSCYALGEFVHDNLKFFLDFNAGPPTNGFMPPIDRTAIGAAAENRPVIGRFELEPDEALILEVEPPKGVYWSYSMGNPWWETIHYGRHQSSLNAHQAHVDSDGVLRVVISSRDPGVANWLDAAGHSNGAMILRCVRTESAPTPTARVVKFADVGSALPARHQMGHRSRAGRDHRGASPRRARKVLAHELLRRRTRRRRPRRDRTGRFRFDLLPRRAWNAPSTH